MKHTALPIIFAKGVKQRNSFVHRSLFQLDTSLRFLHYHDVLELGVCLSGNGTFVTPTHQRSFSAGDVQVILPFSPHYNISSAEGSLWTFIDIDVPRISSPHVSTDPAFFIELVRSINVSGIFCESESPSVTSLVRSIASLLQSEHPDKSPVNDLIAAKIASLLLELSVMGGNKDTVTASTRKTDVILPAIALATASIQQGKKISPTDMASACFVSESHFRKVFSAIMGEPPKTYLCRMQVQRAAALLVTTKLSVLDVSQKCGFDDSSTFYRQFVKTYGESPTSYRARAESSHQVNTYLTD